MDEYFPSYITGTGKPVRFFLQIAEYLSERGFAVLRYNKRGVGLNDTLIDRDVYMNKTFQDIVQDAGKALQVLRNQPEVDKDSITIIGHSEGAMIAPRMAIDDPKISNIVLLSGGAQNLREIVYFQLVDRRIAYAEDTLDTNSDGLLSVQEVKESLDVKNVMLSPIPPQGMIQNSTGEYDWRPGLDTNGNGYFDIIEELKPRLLQTYTLFVSPDPTSPLYDRWFQTHLALKDDVLSLIGNVTSSILIMQGEGDTQAPLEQALLLEQRLTEVGHPDHTLITYPGLGHSFYPVDGWIQP